MLYLLWALINIGIFIFFIISCFRITKIIREKIGLFATIIFVLGLLSFVTGSDDSGDNNNQNKLAPNWIFNPNESIESYSGRSEYVTLKYNLISTYGLFINYGISKEDQRNIPLNAGTTTSGLTSGTKWIPSSVTVNTTDDNKKFQYEVDGVVEWRLLGFMIFSQSKSFRGTVAVKP